MKSDGKSAFAVEVEEQLVRRAQAGDREALYEIYCRFEKPAYTLAFRFCQCPDRARDILQDGMLSLVENIDQYRFEGPFWGWTRKLFINCALMWLRRGHRADNVEVLVDDQVIVPMEQPDMVRDLSTAFARLAPERRAVLWLYSVEGYTHREISRLLGYTESYSKTQLMRARRQIRQWWGQHGVSGEAESEILDDKQ